MSAPRKHREDARARDERESPFAFTREELVAICEAAIVPESKWFNRDSADAQKQVGQCWAWLKAGCEFRVHESDDERLPTDDHTIWVTVRAEGFGFHDWGGDKDEETFYLPTRQRLEERDGDWY